MKESMKPKRKYCNAETVDKQACSHVCGLDLGHGGKHDCRLCHYIWKGGGPEGHKERLATTGTSGRQRSTKCLSDSTNTTGKPFPAARSNSEPSRSFLTAEADYLHHLGGFQHE